MEEGSESKREGEARDRSLEGPGGSLGQAGDISLWRGASWLGAALVGFSFEHHDSGLEMEKRKGKN